MAISTRRRSKATITCLRTMRPRLMRCSGDKRTAVRSQGYVAVLAPRVLELLGLERGERAAHPTPRAVRHDHVVDEAAIGRHERVGELLAIFLGALGDLGGVADIG